MRTCASLSLILAAGLGFLAVDQAAAATVTWDGGGGGPSDGNGTWNAANTNWWNGAAVTWTDNNDAVFGIGTGSTTPYTVTLGSGFNPTVGNLTFANQAYTLTGETINLGATSAVQVDAGNATIASVLGGGSASLTKTGAGTLTLSNANTYTGTTTVTDGNLRLASTSGPAINGNLTVDAGKWLLLAAANQLGSNSALTLNGEVVLMGNDLTVAGLSGIGSIQNDHNWSPLGPGPVNIPLSTLTVNNSSNSTFSGVIRDTVFGNGKIAMIKSGNGTLTLTNDNSFTGGMAVNAGTLALAGGNGARTAGNGTLTINSGGTVDASAGVNNFGFLSTATTSIVINGGTLIANNDNHLNSLTMESGTVSGGTGGSGLYMGTSNSVGATITTLASNSSAVISSRITPADTIAINVADGSAETDLLISGAIANTYGAAGGITKTGNGKLVITGTNSYTGVTTINAGTLQLGDGTSGHDSNVNSSSSIINNAMLAFNLSGNVTNSNVISGTGNLTKTGAGKLTLESNNIYSGTTTINGGTLDVAGASGWALNGSRAGNDIIVNSGATLQTTYSHQFGWTGTLANITINDGGTFNGSHGHYIGQLALNGNATVFGTDYLGLSSGVINYSGTGAQAGSIAQNLQLQDTSGTAVNVTVSVAGSNPSGDLTISGAVAGPAGAGLTKSGAGTLVLTATNTYTGNTTVNAGTLLINGDNSAATGAVLVDSGATLGGSGTIGGATTINGNLAPGNSPGILTFASSLTLNGTTTMQINGNTARGTDFDGINVGTSLTYGGNMTLSFGATFGVGTYTWDLFSGFSSQSGNFAAITLTDSYSLSLSDLGSGNWGATVGNDTWSFSTSTGDLGLTVAVPEPTTWALLALSLTTVVVLRRRRA